MTDIAANGPIKQAQDPKACAQFVELSKGRVHYQLTGPKNAPLVVLVHGFSVWSFIWEPTVKELNQAGYKTLCFDLYGRGFSDRPRVKYNRELFDEQVSELLKALSFSTPVFLAGLSMGGGIAACFTANHPEQVKGLMMIDPAGASKRLDFNTRFFTSPIIGEGLSCLLGESYLIKGLENDMYTQDKFLPYKAKFKEQLPSKGFVKACLESIRGGLLHGRLEDYAKAGDLDIPKLLIWGEHDKVIPETQIKAIRQVMPGVDFVTIPLAGHIPHYEKPELVNPILIDFLKTCDE